MICARRVALNNTQLDQVDNSIVIRSVEPADGKESITAVPMASGCGQRVTARRRDTMDIVVRFAIHIRRNDLAGRATALEKVNAWAAIASDGAWLTVNYKTGRRLWVVLAQAPGEGSLWDYNKEFQITFRAYAVPYWEDSTATTVTSDVDDYDDMTITVPGNAETVVEIALTNKSESTINALTITVDGKSMTFASLGLESNATLTLDHVQTGRQYYFRARIGTTSVMAKRSGVDDFKVNPGNRIVIFSADQDAQAVVSVKGRYL
jgi:hypothetical protein